MVLIDGNNFYASCEVALEPGLRGRPLVVLSNNDGCIVARSAEARFIRACFKAVAHHINRMLGWSGINETFSWPLLVPWSSRRVGWALRRLTPLISCLAEPRWPWGRLADHAKLFKNYFDLPFLWKVNVP